MLRIRPLLVGTATLGVLLAACSGGGDGGSSDGDGGTIDGTDSGNPVGTTDGGNVGKDAGIVSNKDGGSGCSPNCAAGAACKADSDCASKACSVDGKCATGATDGKKDNGESDIDCGGSTTDMAQKCALGKTCVNNSDCLNNNCGTGKTCSTPGASDGIQDFGESDVDCGGNTTDGAPKCANGKNCVMANDCTSNACDVNNKCAPGNADGIKDFGESDIDCGGNSTDMASPCDLTKACVLNNDCASTYCSATLVCVANGYTDGKKDYGESDIDCGGHSMDGAPLCADGLSCADSTDCLNGFCTPGLKCATPTSSDGYKDGTETDVDCGGGAPTNAPACGTGKGCLVGTDCISGGCNTAGANKNKCADAISCTQNNVPQHGGDTCGPNGTDSCCNTITIPGLPQTTTHGGPVVPTTSIDKYNITAGRMRAFVTATNGDMRTWISNHTPTWWNASWTQYLPNQMDSGNYGTPNIGDGVYQEFGPFVHPPGPQGANEGCSIAGNGARSYRLPDGINAKFGDPQYWTQAQDDERSMNCVESYITAAFCAWDGGHLPTLEQIDFLWLGSKPWGTPGAVPALGNPMGYHYAYDSNPNNAFGTGDYIQYQGGTPGTANAPLAPFGATDLANLKYANYNYNWWDGMTRNSGTNPDYTIYIAQPGRFPNGDGKNGVSDLGGNVFNALNISGTNNCWSRSGSWQGHPIPFSSAGSCGVNVVATNKYWAQGGRCAR